jgi:hypothetical protein
MPGEAMGEDPPTTEPPPDDAVTPHGDDDTSRELSPAMVLRSARTPPATCRRPAASLAPLHRDWQPHLADRELMAARGSRIARTEPTQGTVFP